MRPGDKVQRVVDVLDLVLKRGSARTRLSDVVAELGSPLSSTHELLRSMVDAGLLAVDSDRSYWIGPRFLQMSLSTARSLDVRVQAHAHLESLAADLTHDVYLAVRVGDSVTYVDRIPGRGRAAVDIRLGDPVPLHSSAAGKLFCAFAEDLEATAIAAGLPALTSRTLTTACRFRADLVAIRERGYSVSNEETITGIVGLAVPVWSAPGTLLAAAHVSAFRDLVRTGDEPRMVAAMQGCAEEIERTMGLRSTGEFVA